MTPRDVPRVLDIIRRFSEEDHEVARTSLLRDVRDQFVVERDAEVVGLTGLRPIEGTDGACWLSWTYLHDAARGQGLGRRMMEELFVLARKQGFRKVFVTTSDMRVDGVPRYAAALKAYRAVGFVDEVHHPHYYAPDDGQIVLGRRLRASRPVTPTPDERGLALTEVDEIVETDDTWYLDWRFVDDGPGATVADVRRFVDQVVRERGRMIFVGLPSDAPAALALFAAAGFTPAGRLADFYEDGVHEERLRLDL